MKRKIEKTESKKRQKEREKKKLRILAAGDIHGDISLVKKLAKKALERKVDLIILTGDITVDDYVPHGLLEPFAKTKKQVLLVPGNHETPATADFLSKIYNNVRNIHGRAFKIGELGVFGCGSGNIGLFTLHESQIYSLLKKGYTKTKGTKKKLMVTHVHPSGTLMERFTQIFPGSTGVRKAIKQFKPDIAICSHVHEAGGIEEKLGKTKIINVGRKERIIEI